VTVVGLLSHLLLLPLAPARVALWTIDRVVDAAAEQHCGPAAVRRELAELSRQLDQGLIDAEEFDRREDELLDRLDEGRRRGLIA
jgi:cytochrome c-type biogenesis protein CcmH/NrfG